MSPKLELNLDGVKVAATLLIEAAPRTTNAFLDVLGSTPMEMPARHVKWSGPAFLTKIRADTLRALPIENARHLLPPGTMLWIPDLDELLMAYDDAYLCNGPNKNLFGTAFAEMEGDLEALKAKVYQMRLDGEMPFTLRVV